MIGRPLQGARGPLQRRIRGIVTTGRPRGPQDEGAQTGAEPVAEGVVGGTCSARPGSGPRARRSTGGGEPSAWLAGQRTRTPIGPFRPRNRRSAARRMPAEASGSIRWAVPGDVVHAGIVIGRGRPGKVRSRNTVVAAFRMTRAGAGSRIIGPWPTGRTHRRRATCWPSRRLPRRSSSATCAPSSPSPRSSTSRARPTACTSRSRRSAARSSALEKLIGCDLLRRSTHRVELTLAGEALLERTHGLLEGFDEAVSHDPVGGRRARVPPRPVLGAGVRHRRFRDLARRAPRRDRGPVRPVPTARRDRGRAGERRRRCLVSDQHRPRPPGDRHLPPRRRPRLRLLLRPSWRDRRRRRGRGRRPRSRPSTASPPEHPFPADLEDAERAYRWMVSSGVDPARIVVAGDSSGAGLGMSLLLSLKRDGGPMPGGAVWFCPVGRHHRQHPADRPAGRTSSPRRWRGLVLPLVDDYLAGHPIDEPAPEPAQQDLSGLPPMLIQGADRRPAARGRPPAHRARPRSRRRREAGALPGRDALLPDLLVVSPGGPRGGRAGRAVHQLDRRRARLLCGRCRMTRSEDPEGPRAAFGEARHRARRPGGAATPGPRPPRLARLADEADGEARGAPPGDGAEDGPDARRDEGRGDEDRPARLVHRHRVPAARVRRDLPGGAREAAHLGAADAVEAGRRR